MAAEGRVERRGVCQSCPSQSGDASFAIAMGKKKKVRREGEKARGRRMSKSCCTSVRAGRSAQKDGNRDRRIPSMKIIMRNPRKWKKGGRGDRKRKSLNQKRDLIKAKKVKQRGTQSLGGVGGGTMIYQGRSEKIPQGAIERRGWTVRESGKENQISLKRESGISFALGRRRRHQCQGRRSRNCGKNVLPACGHVRKKKDESH